MDSPASIPLKWWELQGPNQETKWSKLLAEAVQNFRETNHDQANYGPDEQNVVYELFHHLASKIRDTKGREAFGQLQWLDSQFALGVARGKADVLQDMEGSDDGKEEPDVVEVKQPEPAVKPGRNFTPQKLASKKSEPPKESQDKEMQDPYVAGPAQVPTTKRPYSLPSFDASWGAPEQ